MVYIWYSKIKVNTLNILILSIYLCFNATLTGHKWTIECIQLTKILLLPPKYKIIILPSNHSNFQYSDSNIGLSLLLHIKLSLLFFASFLMALILIYRSSNYRDGDSCCFFSLLKAIVKRLPLHFANAFKSLKERQLLLSQ